MSKRIFILNKMGNKSKITGNELCFIVVFGFIVPLTIKWIYKTTTNFFDFLGFTSLFIMGIFYMYCWAVKVYDQRRKLKKMVRDRKYKTTTNFFDFLGFTSLFIMGRLYIFFLVIKTYNRRRKYKNVKKLCKAQKNV